MADNNGFIKIHRKIINWCWYQDANTKVVFLHCLLRANHENKQWRNIEIKRGQFISSYQKLANECGLSVRNVRTALSNLETTHEVTRSSTSKYTVFTVLNYDSYQDKRQTKRTQTDTQTDNQATTNKKYSKKKEVVGKNIPTTEQLTDYCTLNNLINVDVKKFYDYYSSMNWMYKEKEIDWKERLKEWNKNERKPRNQESTRYPDAGQSD